MAFITGIILSVFIGDVIDFAGHKITSFRSAMNIKKAEQLGQARRFPEAATLYETVLLDMSETVQPQLFARVKTSQGLMLASLSSRTKNKDDITRAIRAFQESIRVYRADRYPGNYAAAQNNIGILYLQLAEVHNRQDNLHSAISAFDEALRVFTGEKYVENRAMVEANRRRALEEQQKVASTLIMPVVPAAPVVRPAAAHSVPHPVRTRKKVRHARR